MTTTLVPAKPWWHSKTLWINALAGVAAVIAAITEAVTLTPETTAWAMAGLAAVNAVLRLLTTQPVAVGENRVKPVEK